MKSIFSCILVLVLSYTNAQNTIIVDTAQVTIPNRINSIEAQSKPYVIMISADGFRSDYALKYKAENLLGYAKDGVRAEALLPSYPSITFPNHWSLITGMYPAHHGLIDNFFYDYKRQDQYAMNKAEKAEDGSWYGGTPLWSLAEKQQVLSASLQWVGSASDAGGIRPSYYYHYHEKFTPKEKINKVVDWLKLPDEQRPHFIALYFPEVDGAGHRYGPDAEETEQAVRLVDDAIGELVAKINNLALQNVNFIFVSDHGMIKVDKENTMDIPEILKDKNRYDYYNSQTLLRVKVKNPADIRSTYKVLKKQKPSDYKIYTAYNMPRHLHYGAKNDSYQRTGDLFLLPNVPKIFLEKGKSTSVGKHGYDVKNVPEMKATFIAWGPAFKDRYVIKSFENVNVYPVVANILGLKTDSKIDGSDKISRKILKK